MTAEADSLYARPLDEFVRARDELARSLRKEGRREDAEVVKALPKPSVVAWAVNQLAHRRRAELDGLLAAADELRRAQVGGAGDFAAASAAERDAVRALTRAAGELLAEEGRPATDATLDRVASTLRAAAADEEARAELERGVLTREVEATGFGTLLGAMPAAPARRERADGEERRRRERERARAEKVVARARARAEDLERHASAAETEAVDARAAAAEAAVELEAAERALADLD